MLLAFLCGRDAIAQNYAPTDIQVPPGDWFRADAMNDHAEVVGGYSTAGGVEQPVVWRNGVFTQLPLLPGTVGGWARGINNVGQMVGACQTEGTYVPKACVWENGTVRALASVTGTTESAAWAINDAGTIVGHVYTYRTIHDKFRQAVVWQGNTVGKLVPPTAGARTWARAIDNFGRVAVSWTTQDEWSSAWNAARWTPNDPNGTTGTMTTLAAWGAAHDINDAGVVCGNEGAFGYLWAGTSATELSTPYWGYVKVYGVNNSNVAVGSDEDGFFGSAPLVWDQGSLGRDLNFLLTATTPYAYPGSLTEAIAVNASGQILVNTYGVYVLLTPSSDPLPPAQPLPPDWLGAYPGDGEVSLYWSTPYFATSFNVKRSTVSGGPYTTIATNVPWPDYTDTDVVNGTTYYYVVSSVNGDYESADSFEASALPLAPPVAPTHLTATVAKGNKSVELTWTQSSSPAIQWNAVYRSTNGGGYARLATIKAGTTYTDTTTIRKGAIYSYVVTAVNVNGTSSPFSNAVSARAR